MSYRPLISSEVDERVDRYMVGKQGNKNEVYERAIQLLIDSDGDERELGELMVDDDGQDEDWLVYLRRYCDEQDADMDEVLNHILTTILDEDGEGNIQFKGKLDLE